MTILSDIDIKNKMKNNELGIEPFIEKNLTPNGYDLSVDEIFIKKSDEHIKGGTAVIPPMLLSQPLIMSSNVVQAILFVLS